jgi:AP-1 complex subunit beta-1
VLLEFKEYATEVDVDFVRKAVRAIGYCAISIQSAAERCGARAVGVGMCRTAGAGNTAHFVAPAWPSPCPLALIAAFCARPPTLPLRCINVLLELIQTKVNYVVQESIIVIKDIFRCLVGWNAGWAHAFVY